MGKEVNGIIFIDFHFKQMRNHSVNDSIIFELNLMDYWESIIQHPFMLTHRDGMRIVARIIRL